MFMRVDKLQAELPAPKRKDPNAAAALQELLGGKYGEMSTLGNYMFQSFNFRSARRSCARSTVSWPAITAEELGHVELVSNGVAMLANGPDNDGDDRRMAATSSGRALRVHEGHPARSAAFALERRRRRRPVNGNGQSAGTPTSSRRPATSSSTSCTTSTSSAARACTSCASTRRSRDPTGREVCGYLLVRGSVHAHAYALALKQLTGVDIEKMLPTPNIPLGTGSPSARSTCTRAPTAASTPSATTDYRDMCRRLGQRRGGAARRPARRAPGRRRHARRRQDPPPRPASRIRHLPRTTRRRRCTRSLQKLYKKSS
jgi:Mn-containing catalase